MIVSISDGIVVVQVVPTGIAPEGDRKCENSGQVGVGPIRHPEVRNGSEGTKRVRRPVPEEARSRGTSTDPSTARTGG